MNARTIGGISVAVHVLVVAGLTLGATAGPRLSRSFPRTTGPSSSPQVSDAAPPPTPASSNVVTSGVDASKLVGTWKGTFSNRPAWLDVESGDGNSFQGLLVSRLPDHDVVVRVNGELSEEGRVEIRETFVVRPSAPGMWNLGQETGRVSGDAQAMEGTGHDPSTRYSWKFQRSSEVWDSLTDAADQEVRLRVPYGWPRKEDIKDGNRRVVWEEPGGRARVLVQAVTGAGPSGFDGLETAFQESSHYKYERVRLGPIRMGGHPGQRWEFLLAKDGGETMHKIDRGLTFAGTGYALLLEAPDGAWDRYRDLFAEIEETWAVGGTTGTEGGGEVKTSSLDLIERAKAEPSSSPEVSQPLTEGDLEGKSAWDLTRMRNEIYARHGLRFQKPRLREYFESQPWYRGTESDQVKVHETLSEVEKANVNLILGYQKRNRKLE